LNKETAIPAGRLPGELSALPPISRALAAATDLPTLYATAVEALVSVFEPADAGVLLLWDEREQALIVQAALGYDPVILRCCHFRKGESMSGKVLAAAEPRLFPTPQAITAARVDIHPENMVYVERAASGPVRPRSALGVPLMLEGKACGVLILEQWKPEPAFTEADIPLLQALADLVALAANRMRLLEETKRNRSADQTDYPKSELLSALAHEMRTPLASIKGYSTALLMEEIQWDPAKRAEFLQIIDEETDKLEEIINDLLESSMIEAGHLEIAPEPILLPRLAREIVDDLLHHTEKHRFVVSFPPNFPIVDADPRRVQQVLRNLLDNAVKYSPHGGLVVVRGELGHDEVVISVADQGVGIAPEHLNRLFERFFRAHELAEHVAGSGLGLPIAQAIVKSHGGRIWAESKLGKGSTFYFTLPLGGLSADLESEE
jgi:signal transduction histidine kinase